MVCTSKCLLQSDCSNTREFNRGRLIATPPKIRDVYMNVEYTSAKSCLGLSGHAAPISLPHKARRVSPHTHFPQLLWAFRCSKPNVSHTSPVCERAAARAGRQFQCQHIPSGCDERAFRSMPVRPVSNIAGHIQHTMNLWHPRFRVCSSAAGAAAPQASAPQHEILT